MKMITHKQSDFTLAPNSRQSIWLSIKIWMSSSCFNTQNIPTKREQNKLYKNCCRGFTLIEMIVSLGLFSIVVTVSVGALLMLVATNQRLQSEQSVMTNLSFALDSMTREIRTGTSYNCEWSVNANGVFASGVDVDDEHGDETNDCSNGNPDPAANYFIGLSFKEGGDSISKNKERILYYFDKNAGKIFRKTGNNAPQSITSSGIFIRSFDFFVSGSDPLVSGNSEQDQAVVTIFIEATETNNTGDKPYYIQTTISQRTLDI